MPIRNPDLSGFCFFRDHRPKGGFVLSLETCAPSPAVAAAAYCGFPLCSRPLRRYRLSLFSAEIPRPHADILFRRAALFRQKRLAPFFPDPPSPLLNASFLSGQVARRFVSRKKSPLLLSLPRCLCTFCRQVSLSRQGQDPPYARAFCKKVDCRPPCAPSPADDNPLRRIQRSRHRFDDIDKTIFHAPCLPPAARRIVFYLYIVIVLYSAYKAALPHPVKRLSQIKFKKPSPLCCPLTDNQNSHKHRQRSARSPALPLSDAKNPRKHRPIRTAKRKKRRPYAMPARKKPLARSQKPPKPRKHTAQSRKKRGFCHQKPAAAAQYPSPHPTRDHANTPRQQQKAPYMALSVARRGKKPAYP